jgi:hypothetical protein
LTALRRSWNSPQQGQSSCPALADLPLGAGAIFASKEKVRDFEKVIIRRAKKKRIEITHRHDTDDAIAIDDREVSVLPLKHQPERFARCAVGKYRARQGNRNAVKARSFYVHRVEDNVQSYITLGENGLQSLVGIDDQDGADRIPRHRVYRGSDRIISTKRH